MKFVVYIIFYSSKLLLCDFKSTTQSIEDDAEAVTVPTEKFCRDRNKTVGDEKNELYNVVQAFVGEKVMLECHYCSENDDNHPKNWYKLDVMDDHKLIEVQLGIENNMSLNRVHINFQHTLIIHNLTDEDAGEYFCKGLNDQESDYKYNYLLDVIVPTIILPDQGNLTKWKMYHDQNFAAINHLLRTSNGTEFLKIRQMDVIAEIVTEWDKPGLCDICGKPKNEGRQETLGHCKMKITRTANVTFHGTNPTEKFFIRSSHLSCRSLVLKTLVPDIFNRTSVIPDFIQVEKCDGICNPDAEGVYKGWKSTKKTGYKFKKTFVLAENAHLTIICPESTLENKVVWKVNGHTIKPGESVVPNEPNVEPRVTVDTFNTLYLYGVTKEEEGNYTCQVDGIRMQNVRVFVVSKAKLLTQAFVRHMMYLAFVLSLTLSCYCAGLVVTWTRRKKFKSYSELVQELKKANKLDERYFDDTTDDESPLIHSPKSTKSVRIKSDKSDRSSRSSRKTMSEAERLRKLEIKHKKSTRESLLIKDGTLD